MPPRGGVAEPAGRGGRGRRAARGAAAPAAARAAGAPTRRRARGRRRRPPAPAATARARPRRARSAIAARRGRAPASRAAPGAGRPTESRRCGRDRRSSRRRGEVGLGERRALEQRVGVADEHQRRVGEPHAAAGALEQCDARLALEHRQLLGDGRRREAQRVGDRGDRPALVQLAQEAQAAQLEHRTGTLPGFREKSESLLMASLATMAPCALLRNPPLRRLGDRVRRDGGVRQARLPRGRDGRDAAVGPLLPRRRAVLGPGARGAGGAREVRARGRRDAALALGLGAIGYAAPGRRLLRGARAHRRLARRVLIYTFPAIVAVAAIALGRERLDARALAALVLASGGLGLVLAGAGAGALDPLGTALGARGRAWSTARTSWPARASPGASRRACSPALVCTARRRP